MVDETFGSTGTWFNDSCGFGFIKTDHGDVFVKLYKY